MTFYFRDVLVWQADTVLYNWPFYQAQILYLWPLYVTDVLVRRTDSVLYHLCIGHNSFCAVFFCICNYHGSTHRRVSLYYCVVWNTSLNSDGQKDHDIYHLRNPDPGLWQEGLICLMRFKPSPFCSIFIQLYFIFKHLITGIIKLILIDWLMFNTNLNVISATKMYISWIFFYNIWN